MNSSQVKSANALGELYALGLGVRQSDKRAVELFKKCARVNYSFGQYNLGKSSLEYGRSKNTFTDMRAL